MTNVCNDLWIIPALLLSGLALGSYGAATVWRLRARQLVEDKATGEKVDATEYKRLLPLTKVTLKTDRSRCLSCKHPLAWFDLIPLVSWVGLGGKCRYCHGAIGWFEPLMELGVASMFVISFVLWPFPFDSTLQVVQLIGWLVAVVLMAILFAYDLKWFLLPDRVMFPLIGVGVFVAGTSVLLSEQPVASVISLAIGIVILSGIYLLLWLVSKGQWIGFGDVKLGLALALLLGNWELAFLTLFAANLIGCLIIIPGMVAGKIQRTTRVPFGPLLIVGCVVALLLGTPIIAWYGELMTISTLPIL
ncbi:MAG: A24 family peptidase [Candidatus Saccharimonadales bacterium]